MASRQKSTHLWCIWTRWMLFATLFGMNATCADHQPGLELQPNARGHPQLEQQQLNVEQGQQLMNPWKPEPEHLGALQGQQLAYYQQLHGLALQTQQDLQEQHLAENQVVQQQLEFLYKSHPGYQQQLTVLGSLPPNRLGRGLKQVVYSGTVDPYQGGVTPGFFNYDSNGVTGTHLDVGGFVYDQSADKNYMGFAFGDLFGVGIARDRGWTVQVGAGNLLDVSVTRDAGVGIWLLNGLLNLNWSPTGKFTVNTVAAQGSMSEVVASGTSSAAVTEVVVDGDTATASGSVVAAPTNTVSYVSTSNTSYTTSSTPSTNVTSSSSDILAAASVTSSNSGTAYNADPYAYLTTANLIAAGTTSNNSSNNSNGTASGRPCQGGEVVWVTGTKFKCKYPRTSLVRVASSVQTYANEVAV